MKIIHVLAGSFHGDLDPSALVSGNRGVTGSEQAMIYLAIESARRFHDVTVLSPTTKEGRFEGVRFADSREQFPAWPALLEADVVVSWLTADPLRVCRPSQLRILNVQINDWGLNTFLSKRMPHVDRIVCASESHRRWLFEAPQAPDLDDRAVIVPNGVDLRRFVGARDPEPYSLAYASSPDRGLHWLLYLWPEIIARVPQARLHVFYEIDRWMAGALQTCTEVTYRAMYVKEKLPRLVGHGVIVEGPVNPTELAQRLLRTEFLAYPCDTVAPTEGFSVTTMEACAAGCLPVITSCDALGEIYASSGAEIVQHRPALAWLPDYLDALVRLLQADPESLSARRAQVRAFALDYDWPNVGDRWHAMIDEAIAEKKGRAAQASGGGA